MRVVQDVVVEIALAAIAAFGDAAIGDVFHNMDGAPVVALRVVNARGGNEKSALGGFVDVFLVGEARIAAEGAIPFLGRRVQNFQAVNFVADGFGGTEAERLGEGAIEAQDAISGVVDDDEIGDGVEIFYPLLTRLFYAREKPDVLQRHGCMACESFEKLAFGGGKFAREIHQAQHA